MNEVTMIGVDLAKNVFQLHGAAADGTVVFRKKLTRVQFHKFMSDQPTCIVVMEACGSAHYWAREMAGFGHRVKLIAPVYVKPFVKRQKNDVADAEAIVEAAQRPTMRFVEQKTVTQQARAVVFRTREQFVNQRTEAINALRSHLYEFGYIARKGLGNLPRLAEMISDENTHLPVLVRDVCGDLLEQIDQLTARLKKLKAQIEALAREGVTSHRLQTMPGVGPISALAIETFAPPMSVFRRGRDFAAWLGLVPKQHSSGGKQRLGKTSRMGQRDIRRLLIIGAMSVVIAASRKGAPEGSWLKRMLATKPRLVVAIALANKMARGIWAMLSKQEDYRDPARVSVAGNLTCA
jgi:transposase